MRLFRMTEAADLRYFEQYIGKADAARLQSLDKYQYLHWTGDGPAILRGGKYRQGAPIEWRRQSSIQTRAA
jgi:hypothetical protein